jgi:hypothetical protein
MLGSGQSDWVTAVAAVVKANPTIVRLGAVNTPMPQGYRQAGMYVTIRYSGWPSLDRTFRVSAWQDGAAALFPELTLEGCDTTGEQGAAPPNLANCRAEIIPGPQNFARYPSPFEPAAPVEPNLITEQDLTAAYWLKDNTTTPGPTEVRETVANAGHGVRLAAYVACPAGAYVVHAELKSVGGRQHCNFGGFGTGNGQGAASTFDLIAGVVAGNLVYGGLVLDGSSIVDVGGGWWRCEVQFTTDGAEPGLTPYAQLMADAVTFNYAGDVTKGVMMRNIFMRAR